MIYNWKISDSVSCSDHRAILYDLSSPNFNISNNISNTKLTFSDFKDEEVGVELQNFCESLIYKYPILIAPNTIDKSLETFYNGINQILEKLW